VSHALQWFDHFFLVSFKKLNDMDYKHRLFCLSPSCLVPRKQVHTLCCLMLSDGSLPVSWAAPCQSLRLLILLHSHVHLKCHCSPRFHLFSSHANSFTSTSSFTLFLCWWPYRHSSKYLSESPLQCYLFHIVEIRLCPALLLSYSTLYGIVAFRLYLAWSDSIL
jgi:hypothetical protein